MEIDTTNQQTASPVQNTPPELIVNSSISNQKGFVPMVISVVFLLIVVAGGAYYLGIQNGKSSVNQQSRNTVNPTTSLPSPTSALNVDYKTHTNQKMGLTIKYPERLYVKDFGTFVAFTSEPYPDTEGPRPSDMIEITLEGSYMSTQFDALYKADIGDDVPEAHNAVDVKITKLKNLKFGKYDAVEYILDGTIPPKSGLGRGPVGYGHYVLIKKSDQELINLHNISMDVAKTQSRDPIFNEMVGSLVLK